MKVSIVSAGSDGVGLAIVERLLSRGDAVATCSRSGSAALDWLTSPAAAFITGQVVTIDGGS